MTDLATQNDALLVGADSTRQYLTFTVLRESMAIGILDVKEIIEVANMTRVPMVSGNIRGVINLRGNVVPVVDLSFCLGGKRGALNKRSCIVLVEVELEGERQLMGMLVDAVNEILEIPNHQIQKTPDFGTDIPSEFIENMACYNDGFIILLNINRILTVEALASVPSQNPRRLSPPHSAQLR